MPSPYEMHFKEGTIALKASATDWKRVIHRATDRWAMEVEGINPAMQWNVVQRALPPLRCTVWGFRFAAHAHSVSTLDWVATQAQAWCTIMPMFLQRNTIDDIVRLRFNTAN
eukprot:3738644-Amphidinium_carterae.1